jgi:hypothetical protein
MRVAEVILILLFFVSTVSGTFRNEPCNVCGDDSVMKNRTVKLSETCIGELGLGSRLTCGQLDVLGKFRLISSNGCKRYQNFDSLQIECGCVTVPAPPSISPVPKRARTRRPTSKPDKQMGMN